MKTRLAAFIVIFLTACSQAPQQLHLSGRTMGTTYNIKYVPVEGVDAHSLQTQVDSRLLEINKLMSTYDPDSELSRFNQWQSVEPFQLSPETADVLKEALRLGELSKGVLDVTVGPLVNLWGFGPNARPQKIPTSETITEVRSRIGLDKLAVNDDSAEKAQPGLYVDLSTIAKGYGVDQLADILLEKGIHNFLVEIGGEMRVAGKKLDGSDWRIAVEKPVTHARAMQRIISIGDNAIATSGDYRNYYELDGVRYSHLIDPRTGYPIQHNLVSVTVVHPSSMTADGLSTALIVMGLEQAMQLAVLEDIAALMVTKEGEEFVEYASPAFNRTVATVRE